MSAHEAQDAAMLSLLAFEVGYRHAETGSPETRANIESLFAHYTREQVAAMIMFEMQRQAAPFN